MKVLVTGASGVAGIAVCRELKKDSSITVRRADAGPPVGDDLREQEFLRCDTRTVDDVRRAVDGVDAVIHLAAWHCGHNPPVSDETIWAVNVDGSFNVFQAAKANNVRALVYASSMAFGWGGVYGLTKVIGEDLCRNYHESMRAGVAMLRYHDFVPKPYLRFGEMLLRNGLDARDVATATVASMHTAANEKIGLFRSVIHTNHGMPAEVVANFGENGRDWLETKVTGAGELIDKYSFGLPGRVEQHDMSEAKTLTGWAPEFGIVEFFTDLKARDARGEDVRALWAPGQIPA